MKRRMISLKDIAVALSILAIIPGSFLVLMLISTQIEHNQIRKAETDRRIQIESKAMSVAKHLNEIYSQSGEYQTFAISMDNEAIREDLESVVVCFPFESGEQDEGIWIVTRAVIPQALNHYAVCIKGGRIQEQRWINYFELESFLTTECMEDLRTSIRSAL